jgi:hypothetical protein
MALPRSPHPASFETLNTRAPRCGWRFHLFAKHSGEFGKINLKRGHRVMELVLKYYF